MPVRRTLPWYSALAADGLVALVIAGLSLAQMQGYTNPRDQSIVSISLVLLQTLPLALRRRSPFGVFAVGAISLSAQFFLGFAGPLFAYLGFNLSLYTLAAYGERRVAVLGAGIAAAMITTSLIRLLVVSWPHVRVIDLYDVLDDFALLAAAWIMGDGMRRRQLYTVALEDRAVRLERDREEKARQAVTQERLRIARELHDVVASGLSVIGVQAGALRLILGSEPGRAREVIASIETTANRAMTEMRRALGLLRETGDTGVALTPPPGLAQLPTLLNEMGKADLPVHLTVTGTPRPLATSIDLSLYRIVQEALTNSLKHAGGACADVVVRYGEHDVEVEITDDGHGPSSSWAGEGGAGAIGMRERVTLFGGELWIGPRRQGGCCVRARLPTSPDQQ